MTRLQWIQLIVITGLFIFAGIRLEEGNWILALGLASLAAVNFAFLLAGWRAEK